MNKKIGFGCLGLFVFVVAAFIVWAVIELPVLDSEVELPETVTVDEKFDLIIRTSNPHEKAVTLDSLDVSKSFLDGFQVVSITPDASDTLDIFSMRSFSFGTKVEPGETLDIVFRLRPVRADHFAGQIDVCNPNQDFESHRLDLVVREP